MTRLKKALSVVAAASLMASALLIAPLSTSASVDKQLADGSGWLFDSQTAADNFSGNAEDGYSFAAGNYSFQTVQKKAFPVATTEFDFKGHTTGWLAFSIAKSCTLDNVITNVKDDQHISFLLPMSPENTRHLQINDGTGFKTLATFTATRNSVLNFKIVKQNGHWYLSVKDNVFDGGSDPALQELAKLDNYFDASYFENNTPAYFRFASSGNIISECRMKAMTTAQSGWAAFVPDSYTNGDRNSGSVTNTGTPATVNGSAANGYSFTLPTAYSHAKFLYPHTDLANQNLAIGFEVAHDIPNNLAVEVAFTTNVSPKAPYNKSNLAFAPGESIQFRFTWVPAQGRLAIEHVGAGGVKAVTDVNIGKEFFDYLSKKTNSAAPRYGNGNTFSLVRETGADGNDHWYVKVSTSENRSAVLKSSDTALDSQLRMDTFMSKPVYVVLLTNSIDNGVTYHLKNDTAATAAEETASELETSIAALTDDHTAANIAAIESALNAFMAAGGNTFLSPNAAIQLYTARSALPELKIARAIEDTEAAIDAIDITADQLSTENLDTYRSPITNAYSLFAALGDNASRVNSAKADKITALSSKLGELDAAYQANKQAAEAFDATVTALGKPEDITVANYTAKKAAVEAARAAYSALTPEVSALVNPLSLTALKAVEDRLPAVKKAVDADAAIKALPAADAVTLQNEEAIQAARAAYDALEADKSLIAAETLQRLTDAEARIPQLKADAAAALIGALPAPGAITLQDEAAVKAARAAYNALPDKALVAAETLKKLTDAEAKIAELKLDAAGDWYVNDDDKVKYTGSEAEGWQFEDCRGKGSLWATTTKDYDMTKDVITWAGATAGDSGWFTLSLTTDPNTGLYPAPGAKNGLFFILTPQAGNTLIVQCWTQVGDKMEAVTIASDDPASLENGKLTNFNLDGTHTYSFVKQDGHWYLKIDSHLFTGRAFDNFDAYMEANAAKTKVRIGGNNGFRTNGIQIANMEQSGDWWFSVLMGSATEGSAEDGYKLSVPAGAYAQYNLPIKNLENNPVYINFNANLEGKTNWAPEFAFVTGPNVDRKPTPGQGVAIRLVDKPEADPGNTHILAWAGTEWKTLTAVPACGGKDLTISVIEDGVQGHWYLQVAGKILSSSDPEIDKYLQMDNMVKGKDAYFRVASASENGINPTVAFAEKKAEEPEETATDKFLALLNEHYDAASAGDKDALTLLAKAWNALDYFTQMDVEARLLDTDEGAYELLQIIKAYTVDDETSSGGNDDENSIPDTGSALPAAVLLLTALSAGTLLLLRKRK